MKYYSLTVQKGAGELRTGERFCNALKPLTIGQQASADIHLPLAEELLPQCFCSIVKTAEGSGWLLIRKSDFYAVMVNDEEIDFICRLNDGDTICAGECTFVFCAHDDDRYVEGQGVVRQNAQWSKGMVLLWFCSLVLVVAALIGYQVYSKNMGNFTSTEKDEIQASVYKIAVKEIILQRHIAGDAAGLYQTVYTYEPDSMSIGTCFFTQDSLCVTARHCVEPWVDYNGWSENSTMSDLPQDIRWVAMAEQSQLEQSDTLYRVVSRCQVLDGDSCIYEFTSDKCNFNRSRDIITHMGNEGVPWRIIYPLYARKNVELGDFAFLKTLRRGTLLLATESYIADLANDDDYVARIYGFPKTNHGNLWEHQDVSQIMVPKSEGEVSPQQEEPSFDKCLQLIVNGTSGFSGAPVIVKKNGSMMVVGIFSKIDDFVDSKNVFYAVPSNEVSQYNPAKANETIQYRR